MFSLFLTGIRSIGNLTVFAHAFHQPARLWKYYIAPLQRKQIFYCKGCFFYWQYNISGRKQNLTLQRCNLYPIFKKRHRHSGKLYHYFWKNLPEQIHDPVCFISIWSETDRLKRIFGMQPPETSASSWKSVPDWKGSIFRLYHFILYLYPSIYFHNFKGHAPQRPQIIRNSFFQWKQAA